VVPGFSLGANIDAEPDGQPDPAALGDDQNILYPGVPFPPGDEDGVTLTPLVRGSNACVTVNLTSGPAGGFLDAWVDFDRDGIWTAAEQVFTSAPLFPGWNPPICFSVPANAALGRSFARFRLSSTGGLTPSGVAMDGEVEDYLVRICQRKPATNVVITNIVVTNITSQQVITLQWNAEAGISYQMQELLQLTNAPMPWTDVGPEIVGPANTLVVTNSPAFQRYYRVKVPEVCP